MSAPGRPKREYRSAQHEGAPVSAPGRPKREYRSAQHEGAPVNRMNRITGMSPMVFTRRAPARHAATLPARWRR
jgi:hypothetical protein